MGEIVLSLLLGGEVNWVNQEVVKSSETTTLPIRYGISSTAAMGCHCKNTRKQCHACLLHIMLSSVCCGEVDSVSQEVVSSSEAITLPTRYGVSSAAAVGCHCRPSNLDIKDVLIYKVVFLAASVKMLTACLFSDCEMTGVSIHGHAGAAKLTWEKAELDPVDE